MKEEIYVFEVEIKNIEGKMKKEIKIDPSIKITTFVYTILAAMNATQAKRYRLYVNNESILDKNTSKETFNKKVSDFNFSNKDIIEIFYGKDEFTFVIKLIDKVKKEKEEYPVITEEDGYGVLEDITDTKSLNEIIKKQEYEYNKFGYTLGYQYYRCLGNKKEVETFVYNMPLFKSFDEKFNVFQNVAQTLEMKYIEKYEVNNE